ncbi:hypothetical protein PHYPSEUDO_007107 [Phytophthora pseudosyringae]|uniref:Uncharacterized protein n=1 Tax=Phytophthora pseudosyringae TaxID=221518 RepID=A0A8T1WBI6_9STRA|nr:hypothetical protein PHYPSEUDO_007107 [Phytophthora pseudosyringae]
MDPSASAPSIDFSVGYFPEMDEDFHAAMIREERRCRYPSKRCELPRAIKRNGEMHRFCDAHRNKANLNQRRLEARRKRETEEVEHPSRKRRSTSPDSGNSADSLGHAHRSSWSEPCESSSPPLHSVFEQGDLNFLSELLSQNSLEDLHAESAEVELTGRASPYDARFPC